MQPGSRAREGEAMSGTHGDKPRFERERKKKIFGKSTLESFAKDCRLQILNPGKSEAAGIKMNRLNAGLQG
jgi:hypothetical protein